MINWSLKTNKSSSLATNDFATAAQKKKREVHPCKSSSLSFFLFRRTWASPLSPFFFFFFLSFSRTLHADTLFHWFDCCRAIITPSPSSPYAAVSPAAATSSPHIESRARLCKVQLRKVVGWKSCWQNISELRRNTATCGDQKKKRKKERNQRLDRSSITKFSSVIHGHWSCIQFCLYWPRGLIGFLFDLFVSLCLLPSLIRWAHVMPRLFVGSLRYCLACWVFILCHRPAPLLVGSWKHQAPGLVFLRGVMLSLPAGGFQLAVKMCGWRLGENLIKSFKNRLFVLGLCVCGWVGGWVGGFVGRDCSF